MKRMHFLVSLVIAISLLAACAAPEPEVVEKEVTRIVEETIIETVVETVMVEGTPQVVESEVTRVVEVEVVVTPTPPPPEPKILRIASTIDQYRYDPDLPTDVTVGNDVRIFDTLIRFDENFGLQPWLATEWNYDVDRGVWVFQLRDDVYFHDGVQLKAEHIADYFNYFAIDSPMAVLTRIEEGATVAVDDFTLEITTANVGLPGTLTHSTTGIRRGDAFAREHIGTGAFIFEEYVPNEYIRVSKNPDWWGGEPSIDGIELRFVPDPMTRLLALQAGEVDIIADPPRDAMAALEGREDIALYHAVASKFMNLDLNLTGEEPFTNLQDPAVREALGFAIDRQALIDSAWGGFAEMGQTLIAAGLLGDSVSLIEGYTYDPDRSRTVLEEAGWVDEDEDGIREKDGKRLALRIVNGYPNAEENGPVPEVLQAHWAEVGIDLEIINVSDWPGLSSYLSTRTADMFLETWTNTAPAPCMIPTWGFYLGESTNFWQAMMAPAHVGYTEYNDEVDSCSSALTQAEAERWAAEAVHTVIDEARTSISLFGIYNSWAASTRVVSFAAHPVHSQVRWDTTVLAD
jgi:peptide/nickel transport system substrate-binding protein